MFRGIETAASGMASVMDLNDIIANNLANINTPGFKQLVPTFKQIHEVKVKDNIKDGSGEMELRKIGTLSLGSVLDTTQLDFKQGALKRTDAPFAVALNGEGFFVVQDRNGEEFYTRNGSFSLNEEGDLVTTSGDLVVGKSGRPIYINLAEQSIKDIHLTDDGMILLNNEELDGLMVVNFEDLSALKARGNSLFENSDPGNRPMEMERPNIVKGFIEGSNASVVESLINSITGARTYETLSKVIQSTDATLKRAVNDVGRVMQ